jgi:uncharacterized protein with FMN-binding domain
MVIFRIKINGMLKYYREYSVKTVDFKALPDGIYRGGCKVFVVGADVEAKVQDHRLNDIKIVKQNCGGKKWEGREVIDRVLKDQTLGVDAVTGSTASSKAILIALERAFASGAVK